MVSEEELRLKLRKIEALFEGAGTLGERDAAGAALERLKTKLAQASKEEASLEYTFTLSDQWSRQLFIALSSVFLKSLSVCLSKAYDRDGPRARSFH